MERPNRVAIDDICGTLVEVREKASHGGYGLLAYLINEAFEEAKNTKVEIDRMDKVAWMSLLRNRFHST